MVSHHGEIMNDRLMRYNAVLEAGGVDDVVVDGLGVGLCVRIAKANSLHRCEVRGSILPTPTTSTSTALYGHGLGHALRENSTSGI